VLDIDSKIAYIDYREKQRNNIMTYLSENQIDMIAEECVTSYEMTADWSSAKEAALEYSLEVFNVKPSKTAMLLVLKRASLMWQGAIINTKNAIANS